jgi:hypothetical protein
MMRRDLFLVMRTVAGRKMKIVIDELKREEEKYRGRCLDKSGANSVLDGLNEEAFKLATARIQNKGLEDTYKFFKSQRDKLSQSNDRLAKNLAHAYVLVVGKLWKHYKKEIG